MEEKETKVESETRKVRPIMDYKGPAPLKIEKQEKQKRWSKIEVNKNEKLQCDLCDALVTGDTAWLRSDRENDVDIVQCKKCREERTAFLEHKDPTPNEGKE